MAFNSLQHNKVISSAAKLGVRHEILRVLAAYLSKRTTFVRWGEEISDGYPARGGSGQGTLLSVLIFVITFNELIEDLDTEINIQEHGNLIKSLQLIYVDDLIILYPYKPNDMIDEFGDKIFTDKGPLSAYLKKIEEFSVGNGLQLNYT